MHRFGIALLIPLLAACLDAGEDRTRRDFEDIGHARLGPVALYLDPGVALSVDEAQSLVRFRANAPAVRLDARTAETRVIHVEITNVFEDVILLPSQVTRSAGAHAIAFDLTVPPEGASVRLTRPEPDVARPFRFAWVGDVQGGNARFAAIRARINADPSLEFVVFAGDVSERGLPGQIDAFLAAANPLATPWYSLIGNHENIGGNDAVFQRKIGRINVAFDYRGARLVLVDSASGGLEPRVWQFLRDKMAGTEPKVRLVGMHIPPVDFAGLRDGAFASRLEGAKVMQALSAGGVDALFAGHLHTLDFSGAAGVPIVVSGNGGVGFEAKWDGSSLHYLAVAVDPASGKVEISVVAVE